MGQRYQTTTMTLEVCIVFLTVWRDGTTLPGNHTSPSPYITMILEVCIVFLTVRRDGITLPGNHRDVADLHGLPNSLEGRDNPAR